MFIEAARSMNTNSFINFAFCSLGERGLFFENKKKVKMAGFVQKKIKIKIK